MSFRSWLRGFLQIEQAEQDVQPLIAVSDPITELDSLALAQMTSPPLPELGGVDYFAHLDCYMVHVPPSESGKRGSWMCYVKNWNLAFEGQTPEVALDRAWQGISHWTYKYNLSSVDE